MKITLTILISVVLLIACTAITGQQPQESSQEQANPFREAKPDEIPFVYDSNVFSKVRIEPVPKRVTEPDSFPDDAPAHSCFHLEDKHALPALEKGPRYFYPAYSLVCIIPLTDSSVTNFAQSYPNINDAAVKLRKLLTKRSARFTFHKDLNDLPFNNASGVIKSRVQYLSFKTGKGVLFLTQYSQELHPNPINNEELTCDFQGLSNDGKYYVAARFAITHPSLPKGIDFTEHIERDDKSRYLKTAEQRLNAVAEDSFRPSLAIIKSLVASISTK